MKISAFGSREIQATILAVKSVDREVGAEIRKRTKSMVGPAWQEAVGGNVRTRRQARVLGDYAKVRVTGQNVYLEAGASSKKLTGGGTARELVKAEEFGADRSYRGSYTGRRGQTSFTIRNRQTQRQLSSRSRSGYVVYPAAARVIPRLASLWVQTTIRTFLDLTEKR